MTDLEINGRCAKAMGFIAVEVNIHPISKKKYVFIQCGPDDGYTYGPLHDDAQAMALVKKFNIHCIRKDKKWWANCEGGLFKNGALNQDLNRAICECVAKMQKEKA